MNEESSFLIYTDYNNLYGKAMCKKLPANDFKWEEDISKFDEHFIKNYDEEDNKGYFIEADIEYPKELHEKHSDFPFLCEKIKIDKCEKLVCNLYDKKGYIDRKVSLKQALNNGLKIIKIRKVLSFYQED